MNSYTRFAFACVMALSASVGCAAEESASEEELTTAEDALVMSEIVGSYSSVHKGTFRYLDYSVDPDVKEVVWRTGSLYLRQVFKIHANKIFEVHSDLSATPNGPRVGLILYDTKGTMRIGAWGGLVRKRTLFFFESKENSDANRNYVAWVGGSFKPGYELGIGVDVAESGVLHSTLGRADLNSADQICAAGCKRAAAGATLPPVSTVASLSPAERALLLNRN